MAHIVLTGATGTAGSGILSCALKSPKVSRISILSRRPVKLAENEPKAQVIIHKDFSTYSPELLDQLKGATGCIWAQGISSRGMAEDDYTKITVDYPVAAARALGGLGQKMTFVYVSGEGVDAERLDKGVMFSRVKGRAEQELLKLQDEFPSLSVYNIRPGVINPEGVYLAERTPTTMQDRAAYWLGSAMEVVYKGMVISTEKLGKASVLLATGDGKPVPEGKGVEYGGRLLRNSALRKLAEESH